MSLKVKCNNGDCDWRGELVDYNNHITDKCPNRVVPVSVRLWIVFSWLVKYQFMKRRNVLNDLMRLLYSTMRNKQRLLESCINSR